MPSDSAGADNSASVQPSSPDLSKAATRGAVLTREGRSPLQILRLRLGIMAGWARKAGHEQRAAAFADALRMLASIERDGAI